MHVFCSCGKEMFTINPETYVCSCGKTKDIDEAHKPEAREITLEMSDDDLIKGVAWG